jgi:hypothetical protein
MPAVRQIGRTATNRPKDPQQARCIVVAWTQYEDAGKVLA